MNTIDVVGNNGVKYTATRIGNSKTLYVIGKNSVKIVSGKPTNKVTKYIVKVVDGRIAETVCLATAKMVAFFTNPHADLNA